MNTTRSHGMHGVQDLANVLLRAGRSLAYGHWAGTVETIAGLLGIECVRV